MTKTNTYCTIEVPAALRSENCSPSARNAVRVPFGISVRLCRNPQETNKWPCQDCERYFWQRFPGILPCRRATEPFRRSISLKHFDGISRRRLSQHEGIGSVTVERWFQDFLKLRAGEWRVPCPQVLGIDEHFFTRRQGYATTLCDLKNHTIYDVVLGRSEASLEAYFLSLEGKHLVRVVCMGLASHYRALVRKHFSQRAHRGRPASMSSG